MKNELNGREAALATKLRSELTRAEKQLAMFAENLSRDPEAALGSSDNAFLSAAEAKAARVVLYWLESEKDFDTVKAIIADEVNRMATQPSFSTSTTHNLMGQYTLRAYSRIAETISYMAAK